MKRGLLMLGLVFAAMTAVQAETWKELMEKGNTELEGKNYTEAVKTYTSALALKPNMPLLLVCRGKCYANLGRKEEAFRDIDKAVERQLIDNGYWETEDLCPFLFEKAAAYDMFGRYAEAIPIYEKVIALNKDFPYGHNNLAWLLASCPDASLRDPKRAIELVKVELDQREWKNGASLDTLATAYAAMGSFDEAVQTLKKAMELDSTDEEKKEFQEHMELFLKKQPFVQSRKP
jgi:tetratricopeptide (TPR) repeat protein